MSDRSKLESLRDVSVTRIGDTLSCGFPQTDSSLNVLQISFFTQFHNYPPGPGFSQIFRRDPELTFKNLILRRRPEGFCVADFATLSDERRSRSKIFYYLIWIKEPCVREFGGLARSKLLGISQTVFPTASYVFLSYGFYPTPQKTMLTLSD